MKFTFKDILSEIVYDNTLVCIVAGQYNIFNNIVVDTMKNKCKSIDEFEKDIELMDEFDVKGKEVRITLPNKVDFNTFMDVIDMPNINGKWFCNVELRSLSKKQVERFEKYSKNPSDNGILIVTSSEFKEFSKYLKHKTFTLGRNTHIIQLGFPSKKVLVPIVKDLFKKKKLKIDDKSAELFVMRMSNTYDDYELIIENISLKHGEATLKYEQVHDDLKGIENYVIDDVIEKLLVPLNSDTVKTNRAIYKMLAALLKEMEPMELVNKIRYKIDDYIEFRIAINKGIIPIKVRYSVEEAKGRLGEDHKLYKIHNFRFRHMAYIASLTSLKDWVYMRMILNNTSFKYDRTANEKVLYTLMHRSVLNRSRLNNDLGIENIIQSDFERINKIQYKKDLKLGV